MCELLPGRVTPVVLPSGFTESLLASGLDNPTAMAVAPDGRVFIAEQVGRLMVVRDGRLLDEPAVSFTVDSTAERGLLGVAIAPDFATSSHVYVFYTVPAVGGAAAFNRVSRVTLAGDAAVGEEVLVELDGLFSFHHNGGAMQFGPDGKLYVAVGDGFNPVNAQSLANRMGKILRYNPDGSIPDDNPASFPGIAGAASGANRAIWAVGLRNPYTFSFAPGGRMLVNDVGQDAWEEVNEGGAGRNFGWPTTEGDFDQAAHPDFTRPVYAYSHGFAPGQGYAVAGGAFYDSGAAGFPGEYDDNYFFADYVTNWIWRLDAAGAPVEFATGLTGTGVVGLAATPTGELVYLARNHAKYVTDVGPNLGGLYLIRAGDSPAIAQPPVDARLVVGESATFAVAATGAGTLQYQWQRDGVDIPGATGPEYDFPNAGLADDAARFRVVVTSEHGTAVSGAATLTVKPGRRPVALILTPEAGTLVSGGLEVFFSGDAADPEDGALPDSAFAWRVDYVTGGAQPRPFVPPMQGIRSGRFVIPTQTPYTAVDVRFRVTLTVTDADGNTASVVRDLLPQTIQLTLEANVGGVGRLLSLDGHFVAPPYTLTAVVGYDRVIGAAPLIFIGDVLHVFAGWSDGGTEPVRTIRTPPTGVTFTAMYVPVGTPPQTPPPAAEDDGATPPVPEGKSEVSGEDEPPSSPVAVGGAEIAVPLDPPAGVEVVPGGGGRTPSAIPNIGVQFGPRTALGDVTGDGVPDTVVAAGVGEAPIVAVFDGVTGAVAFTFEAFEPSYRGGLFLTLADFDGDGRLDYVVSPDRGGGPRVRIVSGATATTLADFFAFDDPNFRGGVRIAAGDIDGDGVPDLAVAAGTGGGPRVALFDGRSIRAGLPPERLAGDFYVFEPALRDGAYIALGDADGDGRADLAVGAGLGGAPRVRVFAAATLLASADLLPFADFFAGDPLGRAGVTVSLRDADGNGSVDLVAGAGEGEPARLAAFALTGAVPGEAPARIREVTEFDDDPAAGIFVG